MCEAGVQTGVGITLFTLIYDPINRKPDIIVLYQACDNTYAQISAHEDSSWNISDYTCE